MHQTLQFNMIDDKDIRLIIETIWTIIENIQDMVTSSNKSQYKESVYFPFGKHTDKDRALMIINIQYRESADLVGSRVIVTHD